MDRIRQIWVESAASQPPASTHQKMNQSSTAMTTTTSSSSVPSISRPPPLRTSSTYDDDEVFHNVAVNMLSRYENLGLSAQEAILATLISPKQRTSFLEGLCTRIDRVGHCSPITASLINTMNHVFGGALKELIDADDEISNQAASANHHNHHFMYASSTNKPTTPRAMGGSEERSHHLHPSTSSSSSSSSSSSARVNDKKSRRCFFPDSKGRNTIGFFRKRRVQNIDWKLLQSVQRVENLRLDDDVGTTSAVPGGGNNNSHNSIPCGTRQYNHNHQNNTSANAMNAMTPRATTVTSSSYQPPKFGSF